MKKHLMIAALATLFVPSAFAANNGGFLSNAWSTGSGVVTGTPGFIKRQAWDGKRRYVSGGIALSAAALVLLARKNSVKARALYNRVLGRVCSSCPSKK